MPSYPHHSEKPSVSLCTLGCKVNQYESQAIAEDFERLGFRLLSFDEPCDVYVINTCTVTAESDRKSRQMIRRAVKNGGERAIVIVAGCFSQANKEAVEKLGGVSAVFGTADKSEIASYAASLLQKRDRNTSAPSVTSCENRVLPLSEVSKYDDIAITHSERTRAFVKIVDGCENHCAYCIIPRVRGKIRSRKSDKVLDELRTLASNGYREVVLTGIETAAFGRDTGESLAELLRAADSIDGIERIRLGSLEPTVLREDFVAACADCVHVTPHFHLSLQSGSDAVLRGMRRKYNTSMFREKLALLRETLPDVTFTTDIIVGFPAETEEMFRETVAFVRECGFLYVHIFPYSVREGTDAADYPDQVPEEIKRRRAATLKSVMLETRREVLRSFDGKRTSVLFEEIKDDGCLYGHTPHYIEAMLDQGASDCARSLESLCGKSVPCILRYDESTTDYMRCEIIQ